VRQGLAPDDRFYDPSDFDEFILDEAVTVEQRKGQAESIGFELRADANPPFDKFQALCDNDPKFVSSWNRERTDLQDQSASGYDMSLASRARQAGWTRQQIIDLLVAHRRRHGDDLKLDHRRYYELTILNAEKSIANAEAQEQIDALVQDDTTEPGDRRPNLLANLSTLFGIEIRQLVCQIAIKADGRSDGDGQYILETNLGTVWLGGIAALQNQNIFIRKVADNTKRAIEPVKGPIWHKRFQALLDACETISIGSDSTVVGYIESCLLRYFAQDMHEPTTNWEEALIKHPKHPFIKDSQLHIHGPSFRFTLMTTQGEKINQKELGSFLRAFGAEPRAIAVGPKATVHVWQLPDTFREKVEALPRRKYDRA
jgi:hypothetical protein